MRVKIKRNNPDVPFPEKTYDSDFCYDVYAISEAEVAPDVWKYGLGMALQIERSEVHIEEIRQGLRTRYDFILLPEDIKMSIDFRPRSSVWKTGMILSNCEGTIDEGYTNEISAIFYHVMKNMPRYKVGDKIGQIKIGFTVPMTFVEGEKFEPTDRGLNGWGSTGK